jgi:hypothetical protein
MHDGSPAPRGLPRKTPFQFESAQITAAAATPIGRTRAENLGNSTNHENHRREWVSGTPIIGRSHIGTFSALSIGTQVVNRDTPGDCTVFGAEGGDLAFKPRSHRYAEEIFNL